MWTLHFFRPDQCILCDQTFPENFGVFVCGSATAILNLKVATLADNPENKSSELFSDDLRNLRGYTNANVGI